MLAPILLSVLLSGALSGQSTGFPVSMISEKPKTGDFPLSKNHQTASILIDENDQNTVKLSAKLFCEDVERITGIKPSIVSDLKDAGVNCVIIGSIDNSKFIKKLISNHKIDVTRIKGEWESCLTQTVDDPFPGIGKALVITGSDRRGTAYGVFELSKQMGVSPWYYYADVPVKRRNEIYIQEGSYLLKSPSVKYRGIFINDEMWGIRPWATYTLAPDEGKGLGPTTYAKIFELLLRLKANLLWPAMHQQTIPFNVYPGNSKLADEYGIVMGSSHIEPMLRNNIAGAEWDREYPDESWDYVKNRDHIYAYWETRVKANGQYENLYTVGKRGQDDEAGSDITVPVLEQIFTDQRKILKKWVNRDVTKVPQTLIAYTEVLGLYNQGLKVPDDVIICWPDDNFGNIRQLPNKEEQKRSGGSGIYYHFQWLNGATTAYNWTCTTPLGLVWTEMKKAYDFGATKLWVVNVGDIKPAEIDIEYFMQLAWDIHAWNHQNTREFLELWAEREFGSEYSEQIASILMKHDELGYARRPENMVLFNGREQQIKWDWFSTDNYNDEAQQRLDTYDALIKEVDDIYGSLPTESKDAFFQMVVYNVKGTALQNRKIINAQKSIVYGEQKRSSAASYAAKAQEAENEIFALINHYNREQVTVGSKWDHMASLPGPWGGQWHQWDMPPLSQFSGEGEPRMKMDTEGADSSALPGFNVYQKDQHFIDLFNTGNGTVYWSAKASNDWIKLSANSGVIYDEKRIWVSIDWSKAPKGMVETGEITFSWTSAIIDEWRGWNGMSASKREAYKKGIVAYEGPDSQYDVKIKLFNPNQPSPSDIKGFVETDGCISIEAEHFTRRIARKGARWEIIEGLGRSGNSVSVLPFTIPSIRSVDQILINSPSLEYDLYTFRDGAARLQINCSPSYPINGDYGLRLAIALDDQSPKIISYERGRSVMENLLTLGADLDFNRHGEHTLKIWMVDPGVVIDKIIIDLGGVKESYLGPPESYSNSPIPPAPFPNIR